MIPIVKNFSQLEAAAAVVLMGVALIAMLAANSPLAAYYDLLQSPPVSVWINDGLMSVFFLLIGIEIKREMKEGELSQPGQMILPLCAAAGGVIVPALIYCAFNWDTPSIRGWAIPSATDIAFSLGLLALFARRLPGSLRVFLMAVAVIDDLAAVIIIAAFYTGAISFSALGILGICIVLLLLCNYLQCRFMTVYLLLGLAMWAAMMCSGVHPTIAGVLVGLLIPLPLGKSLLEALHPFSAFCIVPLFAFANAGIPLAGLSVSHIFNSMPMGIMLGLFAGKQIGIFMASLLLIRLGAAKLPAQASWLEFYSVCAMAGIGFTMSLFIGALAFDEHKLLLYTRLGVMLGSLASALMAIIFIVAGSRYKAGSK